MSKGEKSTQKGRRIIDPATKQAAWDEMINMHLRGANFKQIGATIGFHYNTIQRWSTEPEYKIQYMRKKALVFDKTEDAANRAARIVYENTEAKIKAYANEAIDRINELAKGAQSEGVKLRANQDLADRGPETQRGTKVTGEHKHLLFTPEMLVLAAQAARESIGVIAAKPLPPEEFDTEELEEE